MRLPALHLKAEGQVKRNLGKRTRRCWARLSCFMCTEELGELSGGEPPFLTVN